MTPVKQDAVGNASKSLAVPGPLGEKYDEVPERMKVRLGREHEVTRKYVAEYLGYRSVSPLHKLTAARRVPFSQDVAGGKCWFLRSELDEWRRSGGVHA